MSLKLKLKKVKSIVADTLVHAKFETLEKEV